jgi:hypothetical protein
VSAAHDEVREHYETRWGAPLAELRLGRGPMGQLDPDFAVLAFAPRSTRRQWRYATCGMCAGPARPRLEVHLFAEERCDDASVEMLTLVAYFHQTGERLGLHHTVNFGQPWMPGSSLELGFLSLPYLDGPELECQGVGPTHVRHLWLLPITRAERELKKTAGAEALESLFESRGFAYADPLRASLA